MLCATVKVEALTADLDQLFKSSQRVQSSLATMTGNWLEILSRFSGDITQQLSEVSQALDTAKGRFGESLQLYGEGRDTEAEEFFSKILQFCNEIDKTNKHLQQQRDQKKKAEMKAEVPMSSAA